MATDAIADASWPTAPMRRQTKSRQTRCPSRRKQPPTPTSAVCSPRWPNSPCQSPLHTSARVVVTIPDTKPLEQPSLPDDVALPGQGSRDRARHGAPSVPPGSLDAWFTSLAKATAGVPDHIARLLGRLHHRGRRHHPHGSHPAPGRFGDGGPGFLAVQVDPGGRRPALRNTRAPGGLCITFGGAGSKYYGLGGTVSTLTADVHGGSKVGDQRQALHRFDIAFQNRPDGGTLVVQVEGGEGATFQTDDATMDAFRTLAAGGAKLVAANGDGPVTIYGVALETGALA